MLIIAMLIVAVQRSRPVRRSSGGYLDDHLVVHCVDDGCRPIGKTRIHQRQQQKSPDEIAQRLWDIHMRCDSAYARGPIMASDLPRGSLWADTARRTGIEF